MLLPISEVTEEKNSHEFESRGNLVGAFISGFCKTFVGKRVFVMDPSEMDDSGGAILS